jgi:CO/xanthine dehydrogenase Mo-binding subunit
MSVTDKAPSGGHVGRELRRKEDPRLITGQARYIDDISLPVTLWAAIVRLARSQCQDRLDRHLGRGRA